MNLYTRQTLMDPSHVEEALAASVEVGQLVTKVTGLEIATWSTIFGLRLGSITWSARVDSQAALAAATAKLIGNADYEKWMNMNRHFFSGLPEDQFLRVVAFEGTPKPGAYNVVIRAQCAPGKIAAAMAWGVETMQYVAKLTGDSPMMVASRYGQFATIGWVTNYDTLDKVDAYHDTVQSDAGYLSRLDEAGDLFVVNSVASALSQRLG